jgi:hypothetical protein
MDDAQIVNAPQVKAGKSNDPSVEVKDGGNVACCTPEFRDVMRLLGFKEAEGSFVYNADGRAIWVNPSSPFLNEDVTKQIVAAAEAIGRRAKINEFRKALDLPFGEVAVVKTEP